MAIRKAFSTEVPFGRAVVRQNLKEARMGRFAYRDELVARSVFYYDNVIRNRSGFRHLQLSRPAQVRFANTMDDNFQPDFATYAQECQTPEDAAVLADVCGRVLRCAHIASPIADLTARTKQRTQGQNLDWVDRELSDVKAGCLKAYQHVLRRAMFGAYIELGKKQPELLNTFIGKLDGQSYKCLSSAIQGSGAPDHVKAKHNKRLEKYCNPDAKPYASLTKTEAAHSLYYDWSSADPSLYSDYTPSYSVLSQFRSRGLSRVESHERNKCGGVERFLCTHDMEHNLDSVVDKYMPVLEDNYRYRAKVAVGDFFRKAGCSCDISQLTGCSDRNSMVLDLSGIALSCSTDADVLKKQAPVLAELCNGVCEFSTMSLNDVCREDIFDGVFQSDYLEQLLEENYSFVEPALVKQDAGSFAANNIVNQCRSHMSAVYDALVATDAECGELFLNSLSEHAYLELCVRRPDIEESHHRMTITPPELLSGGMFDKSPVESAVVFHEVIDQDGLEMNKALDAQRTDALLKSESYRTLLSQCMYHYEFDARTKHNELNRYMYAGLNGKAPNETLRNIAENCRSVDDARVISKIVNTACQVYDGPDILNGSLRDDLRIVLCDKDAFKKPAFQQAFAEGLSEQAVNKLDLEMLCGMNHARQAVIQNLAKNPEVCTDDDIMFARHNGFESSTYYSPASARDIVRSAVSKSSKYADDSPEAHMFDNIGKLAAACCSQYIESELHPEQAKKSKNLTDLHMIISAGDNATDMRSAAKVCNLVFDALADKSDLGPFCDLSDEQRLQVKQKMQQDILAGYEGLSGTSQVKFVGGLHSPSREDVLEGIPGVWLNGTKLNNVSKDWMPQSAYGQKLGAFNVPNFRGSLDDFNQPVFVTYQNNPERGTEIRSQVRLASKFGDNLDPAQETAAADARAELFASCVATYQAYGVLAEQMPKSKAPLADGAVKDMQIDAAQSGTRVSSAAETYSLYELAEQCNSQANLSVLSDAFMNVARSVELMRKENPVRAAGMDYAMRVDMSRAMRFLDAAGVSEYFEDLHSHTSYGDIIAEAQEQFPAYVNKDAQLFVGRSRPKGAKDIRKTMDTETAIDRGLENADLFTEQCDFRHSVSMFYEEQKQVSKPQKKPAQHSVADMQLREPDGESRTVSL